MSIRSKVQVAVGDQTQRSLEAVLQVNVKRNVAPVGAVEDYLSTYKPLVIFAVSRNWEEIKTLPNEMKSDKDVVLAAIQSFRGSVEALWYAEGAAREDTDVLMAAMKKKWKRVMEYVAEKNIKNKTILEALNKKMREANN